MMTSKNSLISFCKRNELLLQDLTKRIIIAKMDKPTFYISICGSSASGKSTISKALKKYFHENNEQFKLGILHLDAFMFERSERAKYGLNGYDPKSHQIEKIVECITQLRLGKPIFNRPYNHATGMHTKRRVKLEPVDIIIFEGVQAFHDKISNLVDFSVFIDGEKEVLKELRLITDIGARKFDPSVAFGHSESEYSNFETFILPNRKKADVVIKVMQNWHYSISS